MGHKGTLSATNLAVHQHLQCDLFLYNTYHGPTSQTRSVNHASELIKALFERGNDWEATLFNWLDRQGLLLTIHSGPYTASDLKESIEFDEREHFYIAGLSFWPPKEALAERFSREGMQVVNFGLFKPDLIEITRTSQNVLWRVIDAKASGEVKTPHFVQIFFYNLCLGLLLDPPFFEAAGSAAVWLPPKSGFTKTEPTRDDLRPVDLSLVSDSMEHLLFRKLPHILGLPREMVRWHYNPLCRVCPFTSECRSMALQEGKIGVMPDISLEHAEVLDSLLSIYRERGGSVNGHGLTDIEDLHRLINNQPKFEALEASFPSIVRKAKRILGIPIRNTPGPSSSALVEAARTKTIRVIHHRNFTCPQREDIAVVLSLVQDPASDSIAMFCISTFSARTDFKPDPVMGTREDLVSALASLIDRILELRSQEGLAPRTQFYTFSSNERDALQRHLLDTALTADAHDLEARNGVRTCIGALSEGANFLATVFQPVILGGTLLDFLSKVKPIEKAKLKTLCRERLGLPDDGTTEQLRARIQEYVHQLKIEGGRAIATGSDGDKRTELGQLPRVVVLKKIVDQMLALPIPGYWNLPECAAVMLPHRPRCSSDDEIFISFRNNAISDVEQALQNRNRCIYGLLGDLRRRVSTESLLVNDARVLSAKFLDLCQEHHLRKLFYMQQFEVLERLTGLWKSRIDGCPDAPILKYTGSRFNHKTNAEHSFDVISGNVDIAPDKERPLFDYLLVKDDDSENHVNGIPLEALFDDLGVSGLVFPLNTSTRYRWNEQHPDVHSRVWVADVRDSIVRKQTSRLTLQTWGGGGSRFILGQLYRLSPRLVDFNITKVLSALVELDLQYDPVADQSTENVPFVQLISNPSLFAKDRGAGLASLYKEKARAIQSSFHELSDLDVKAAQALVLKASQRQAVQRVLSSRLAVILGPPGTGKTYTLALSLLRLLDVEARLRRKTTRIIFLTAMTHAAIRACLGKLQYLMQCYREIRGLPISWLNQLQLHHVLKGHGYPGPFQDPEQVNIYAGTVYQLYNFSKRFSFEVDCVIIDEAGQLALSSVALVLRRLSPTGRVVIAGDSQQLAPIFSARYPPYKPALFGSILDCLMEGLRDGNDGWERAPASSVTRELSAPSLDDSTQSDFSTIVQLRENFRLNPDLGDFVSTIYHKTFKPQKVQAREVAMKLQSVQHEPDSQSQVLQNVRRFLVALSNAMLRRGNPGLSSPALRKTPKKPVSEAPPAPPSISMALIHLETHSTHSEQLDYEAYVHGEAAVAAGLVSFLRQCFPEDNIFVATPHRIQRQAVREALSALAPEQEDDVVTAMEAMEISADGASAEPNRRKVTVETVERLQGSEAAFVICLFSLPTAPGSTGRNPTFLLERRRLNVAISRAKTLCILITSETVLRPPVTVLANPDSAKGYKFLKDYQERAWAGTITVDLDSLSAAVAS